MLKVDKVKLKLGNFALEDIEFEVNENEWFTILGPSGSGKSCILYSIVGIHKVNSGAIYINQNPVHDLPPEDRNIGVSFQDGALFPNLNVFDNIAFGLKLKKVPKEEIEARVNEIADVFQIKHLLNRSIYKLSGGENQRIALARALVMRPAVILLDEPFSKLDRVIHDHLMIEFKKIIKQTQITVIHVTHDQNEAHYLSDRIAVINDGKIMQIDTKDNLFHKPNSKFVAEFVNVRNIYEGKVKDMNGQKVISYNDNLEFRCAGLNYWKNMVSFCIRPEYVELSKEKPADKSVNVYPGVIEEVFTVVSLQTFIIRVNDMLVYSIKTVGDGLDSNFSSGDNVYVTLPEDKIHVFETEQIQNRKVS